MRPRTTCYDDPSHHLYPEFFVLILGVSPAPSIAMTAKPTGFTILQDPPDPELDIVFVHGLQGHPRNTWTFVGKQRVEGTPEKRRFVEVLLCRSKIGSQLIEVFWPQDLLKAHQDCSRARILTYGYDSVIFGTPNLSTIMDQGLSLLNGLARVRAEDSSRPLMLIVHSLGGLVVKAVSNYSRARIMSCNLFKIQSCAVGLTIFFHPGA